MRHVRLSPEHVRSFRTTVRRYYRTHGRHALPWRIEQTPYRVLVSEVMLQQTQARRVQEKFMTFIRAFPSFETLATASARRVLSQWQGLGYNRRALALHRAAQLVVRDHHGTLPRERSALEQLPGIGPYTAGAIRAFVWNEREIFLETNIRTVFIHHFFPRTVRVHDDQLIPLVAQTLPRTNIRNWYAALMDYGAHLKATRGNATRRSTTYARQKPFSGSVRAARGAILRLILQRPHRLTELYKALDAYDPIDIERIVEQLATEGFITCANTKTRQYRIK